MRYALHQATVAEEHPAAVIDDVESRPVEPGRQHLFGQRHSNRIRNALP